MCVGDVIFSDEMREGILRRGCWAGSCQEFERSLRNMWRYRQVLAFVSYTSGAVVNVVVIDIVVVAVDVDVGHRWAVSSGKKRVVNVDCKTESLLLLAMLLVMLQIHKVLSGEKSPTKRCKRTR